MIFNNNKMLVCIAVLATLGLTSCSSRDSETADITPAVGFGGSGNDGFDIVNTESVYAYRQNSPYASVLKECVLVNTRADSCKLSKLPFIGNGTTQPSIEDIMNRVLVTHNWMGQRFEEVLRSAPTEVMTLFSSTTAVLIGSEVRPSFYTTTNGAIQIDPDYLWTTVAEKGSISKQEDFRAGFGNELQFWFLSRLSDKNGDRLTPFYSLDDNSVRSVEDTKLPLIRLLVHELVHATDFMPRSNIAGVDQNLSVYDAIDSISNDWLSPQLYASYPLTSIEMQDFAGVRYRGLEATNQQKAATATDVGGYMSIDGAPQFYSYTTIREDLAQLVESLVMSYRYDAMTNIGFTQKPADEENYDCGDLLVSWGQRNRLADPLVNGRARKATDLVLSLTPAMTDYLDESLSSAESMQINVNWCDNQRPDNFVAADPQTRSAGFASTPESGALFREMTEADSIVHPEGFSHH